MSLYTEEKFENLCESFKKEYSKEDKYKYTDLCAMMYKNRSDKAYPPDIKDNKAEAKKHVRKKRRSYHNYTVFYDFIFRPFRDHVLNIFEMGLGSPNKNVVGYMKATDGPARPGASLYGWSEYFSKSNIWGADIDPGAVFQDTANRIKTYQCDQIDQPSVSAMFDKINEKFDIIVDDGRHKPEYNWAFFESSFPYLKTGGIYIIEDVLTSNHDTKKAHEKNLEKIKKMSTYAKLIKIKSDFNRTDNNVIVVLK